MSQRGELPGDVLVFRATRAAKTLRGLPALLTIEQIDALYDAARWRSTWQESVPTVRC